MRLPVSKAYMFLDAVMRYIRNGGIVGNHYIENDPGILVIPTAEVEGENGCII